MRRGRRGYASTLQTGWELRLQDAARCPESRARGAGGAAAELLVQGKALHTWVDHWRIRKANRLINHRLRMRTCMHIHIHIHTHGFLLMCSRLTEITRATLTATRYRLSDDRLLSQQDESVSGNPTAIDRPHLRQTRIAEGTAVLNRSGLKRHRHRCAAAELKQCDRKTRTVG